MDDAYSFESLVRSAFDCDRFEFLFANADYYSNNIFYKDKSVGLAKINSIIICALFALRKKFEDNSAKQKIIDSCRKKLTQYDIVQQYSYESINDVLSTLYDNDIVL